MVKVLKSALSSGHPSLYSFDTAFEKYPLHYPLRKVLSGHVDAKAYREKTGIYVDLSFQGKLEVEDTSDASLFELPISFDEKMVAIMDEEDGEGEGYIFEGNSFDIEELALLLIESHLPIRLTKEILG